MTEAKENTAFFSIQNMSRKALPFLFSVFTAAAAEALYLGSIFNVYTLLTAVLTLIFFRIYDFINVHRKLGIPVYIALMTVLLAGVNFLLGSTANRIDFVEWFMTGGATIETIPQFIIPFTMTFSFFISSVAYYFTHIIYRTTILTLVSLIPFAIYVKAAQPVPEYLPILIAALDLFMYIQEYRRRDAAGRQTAGERSAFAAYADFAAAVVLIAIIIPKPEETPYYEKFETFTNYFSFSGRYGKTTGSYTSHSGNADDFNNMESKLIYLVGTDKPQYFKIQVFDNYDAANRYWISSRYGGMYGTDDWEEDAGDRNLSSLLNAYIEHDADILENVDEDTLAWLSAAEDKEYSAIIKALDFPADYVLAPQRITETVFSDRTDDFSRMTYSGEVFPNGGQFGGAESYTVSYYDSDFAREKGWISSGLCNISFEDYGELLREIVLTSDYDSDAYNTAIAFLGEWGDAELLEGNKSFSVSAPIRRIAYEITAGLTYDWEKAEAIEQYFYNQGFIYDLGYKAPEESDTPEFFLTESKRGTCSDFATAYCLLANAAGLKVRFTEGFVCGTIAGNNMYQILTENAHSYPEVYIPGAGWTIYEPTVGNVENSVTGTGEEGDDTDYLAMLITCIATAAGIILVVMLAIFMPQIEETFFSLRVKFSAEEKGIILVYRRLVHKISRIYGIKAENLTPDQLTEFVMSETSASAEEIILPFERVCYGEYPAEKGEAKKAYEQYRRTVKTMKKNRKRKK